MSFSVSLSGPGGAGAPRLEWSSGGLAGLLAGGSNALRPGFASMLADMRRFNTAAPAFLDRCAAAAPGAPELAQTMAQFLADGRYGAPFTNWYLVPQMAAVWSGSASEVLAFPARTFIQFCVNHSLLQVRPKTARAAGRAGAAAGAAPARAAASCTPSSFHRRRPRRRRRRADAGPAAVAHGEPAIARVRAAAGGGAARRAHGGQAVDARGARDAARGGRRGRRRRQRRHRAL
jgi:predicted NAD/FAD-binding protein